MSLWHIVTFISFLNSSTNGLLSYPFSLAALLNSCTNFSIIFPPYSSLFNLATFTDSSSPLPNSFLISTKIFPIVLYSNNPPSKFSSIFSFYISADPLYIYDNTYWICFSSIVSLIFILMYSLYAIIKPEIFNEVLSNICGHATFVFPSSTTTPFIPLFAKAWS